MRILFLTHEPLSPPPGRLAGLALGLLAAGHGVEILVATRADSAQAEAPAWPGLRIRAAFSGQENVLPGLPEMLPLRANSAAFGGLSDEELVAYLEGARRGLDRAMVEFDPHVLHCDHVWLLGDLALETGAPYVLTAQGPEFEGLGPREAALALTGAENASAILADSPEPFVRMHAAYPDLDSQDVLVAQFDAAHVAMAYEQAFQRRAPRRSMDQDSMTPRPSAP